VRSIVVFLGFRSILGIGSFLSNPIFVKRPNLKLTGSGISMGFQ